MAALVLNRGLPRDADHLVEQLRQDSGDLADIYLIESGPSKKEMSKYCNYWADWPEARKMGLHNTRGFNYGLLELDHSGKKYGYYFLITGDLWFAQENPIRILREIIEAHPRLGIVSPLSPDWGEAQYFKGGDDLKCVWLIPHQGWLVRRTLLDKLIAVDDPSYMNYFYDGTNFYGYDADTELIIKAYHNDYAVAVTSEIMFATRPDEQQGLNTTGVEGGAMLQRLIFEEGLAWMHKKYGFSGKWEMREWGKTEYNNFMNRHPEYQQFGIGARVR